MENKWLEYYYGQAFPDKDQQGGFYGLFDMLPDPAPDINMLGRPSRQSGGSQRVFRGPVLQRGYGLGNMFKSLSRAIMPTLKEGMKTLGKSALHTGLDVLQDVSRGENFKESAKRRLKEQGKDLLDQTVGGLRSREGINSRQPRRKQVSSKKSRKRKHQTDSENIFTQLEKRKKL